MSYTATVFKVMIASPSDVAVERSIIQEVLSEWNIAHADFRKLILLSVGWETHSVPEMGDRPQAIINKQILNDCDLLVGVFWTRIGTATGEYPSGTIEEIEEHIKTGKPTMLYFSSVPVVPTSIDPAQYSQLQSFKEKYQSQGLCDSYVDFTDFRLKFNRHLQMKLNRDLYQPIHTTAAIPSLSKEAAFLLKESATVSDGIIINFATLGGHTIQVGGKNMIETGSDRSRAVWTSALEELESLDYVRPSSAKRELFRITRAGYDAVERLP
ncbi:hypothetical protein [Nitrosomonas sp. Is37]|uniref:hypothetical protein n=1 Tax=Nitrosomonas sp. Is37 TaxID=3080535 RepID=UPI00294B5BD4|nr:hypothetical protein [Nitrosomonas sp. Is37]MDV6345556.1 hypothetical protein [Nitrosomonas sp. Is37]